MAHKLVVSVIRLEIDRLARFRFVKKQTGRLDKKERMDNARHTWITRPARDGSARRAE